MKVSDLSKNGRAVYISSTHQREGFYVYTFSYKDTGIEAFLITSNTELEFII